MTVGSSLILAVFAMLPGGTGRLHPYCAAVDTNHMRLTDGQSAEFEQQCLTVLSCYHSREAAVKVADPEYSGWVDRIMEAGEMDRAALTAVHGHLIALGLIRIEFSGRARGLQYQVSPAGRDAVARGSLQAPEDNRGSEVADRDVAAAA